MDTEKAPAGDGCGALPGVHRRLSMFTRLPTAGRVKTRLVPLLSPEWAAALQRAMTEDLLDRLGSFFAGESAGAGITNGPVRLELRCDGLPSPATLRVPDGWEVTPQGSGDLGDRLARAAQDARRDGVAGLVLIGSDAPLLPAHLLEAAFAALDDVEVALSPALDGGYVLLGVAPRRIPEAALQHLFAGIPWGGAGVRDATVAAASRAGLRLAELAPWWDVDSPEDLLRLDLALRTMDRAERPPKTAATLEAAVRSFTLPE